VRLPEQFVVFILVLRLFVRKSRQTILCRKRCRQPFTLNPQARPNIVEKAPYDVIIPIDLRKQSVLGVGGQLMA